MNSNSNKTRKVYHPRPSFVVVPNALHTSVIPRIGSSILPEISSNKQLGSSARKRSDTTLADSSSNNHSRSNSRVSYSEDNTLDESDDKQFVNLLRADLLFLQKKLNELKYDDKNVQRTDDIPGLSNCIFTGDIFRTKSSMLELLLEKLSELQQVLLHKTDKVCCYFDQYILIKCNR